MLHNSSYHYIYENNVYYKLAEVPHSDNQWFDIALFTIYTTQMKHVIIKSNLIF